MRLFYALCPLFAVVTSLSLSAARLNVSSPDGNIVLTLPPKPILVEAFELA